jgi:hypothetical protein
LGRLLYQQLDGFYLTKSGSCLQRIFNVKHRRIIRGDRSRNASLGPIAGRQRQRIFGDQPYSISIGQAKGSIKSGGSASNNQNIKLLGFHGLGHRNGNQFKIKTKSA